jgi:hypothetical protein
MSACHADYPIESLSQSLRIIWLYNAINWKTFILDNSQADYEKLHRHNSAIHVLQPTSR